MSPPGKIAPALHWRAFFVCAFALAASARAAAPAKPPELAQVGIPDAAEAQKILEEFRHAGVQGKYFLEFELHALPRRGDEVVYRGRYWGMRNEQGDAINRLEFADAAGKITRLLVQNGEQAAMWRWDGGTATPLDVAASFQPLVPGLEIAAFDLQMPFLYWPDARADSIARVLGRPANVFVFRPPPAITTQHSELAAVRAYFDTQFNALLRIEYLGRDAVTKSIALLGFQKVGEQYVPKSFDVRNEVTRDKSRFVVTGAALNLTLAPAVFTPASLAEAVPPPAGIVRVSP